MPTIDPRVVRITLDVDGEIRTYDGLNVTARGSKTTGETKNECEVTISNLSNSVRNAILTDTSPFNKSRKRRRIIVEAGRERDGIFRLFEGEVTSASPSQPPDIDLTIKGTTGAFHAGVVIARSGSAVEKLSVIAKQVADDLGVALVFEADDKQVANWCFTGAAIRQINELNACGVNAYLDDETLCVKNRGQSLRGRIRMLNAGSGMIGIPEVTERGVKVTCMLDRHLVLGGTVEIESELNPSTNGRYTINKLDFDIASRSTQFYHIIEASRQ